MISLSAKKSRYFTLYFLYIIDMDGEDVKDVMGAGHDFGDGSDMKKTSYDNDVKGTGLDKKNQGNVLYIFNHYINVVLFV